MSKASWKASTIATIAVTNAGRLLQTCIGAGIVMAEEQVLLGQDISHLPSGVETTLGCAAADRTVVESPELMAEADAADIEPESKRPRSRTPDLELKPDIRHDLWPGKRAKVQFLGECLGKPGDCVRARRASNGAGALKSQWREVDRRARRIV